MYNFRQHSLGFSFPYLFPENENYRVVSPESYYYSKKDKIKTVILRKPHKFGFLKLLPESN